jgi:hypothetical protein
MLVHVGYQWPGLLRDANGDHGGPVGAEGGFESRLDVLCHVSGYSDAAKGFGSANNVESWKIKSGNVRSILQNREVLKNGVLVVAGNNVDEL